ncbi:MAG: AMP-binding protein [Solirubrobacteraceae bacterium]
MNRAVSPGEWNFADVWEVAADVVPAACAQVHADRRYTWTELDRRADGVAATLLQGGLTRQDKVALYLYNGPEYLESAFAALKAGLVPVNTNYRYGPQELGYLLDDADATAVVFHGAFTETVQSIRDQLPKVRVWLHVDDGTHAPPEWATPYEEAVHAASGRVRAPWGRSGDDLILIYTGGTTGRPKGVMWRQHDLYRVSDVCRDPADADLEHVRWRITERDSAPVGLPAPPLMHGTAYVFAGTILNQGGTVVTLAQRRLDVVELLDLVERERVTAMCIVGDAFCRPIVDALDAQPERWDSSSLRAVTSAGMMWSAPLKQRLLQHAPNAVLIDFLNSSEASGMGRSITSGRSSGAAARFRLGQNAFVVDEAGNPLTEVGAVGRIAVKGHLPIGYHKDPEKTAATFPVIEGVRCSVPGDYATIEAGGSVTLLGRGSTSINTGGEKVYPEEVEQALKTHPAVRDAVVVGVAHERFGQAVAAAVELVDGAPSVSERELADHVGGQLARYKAPRHVIFVDSVGRSPSGKADYRGVSRRVNEALSTAGAGGPEH